MVSFGVAEDLALEDLEGDRRDQVLVAGIGGDLQRLLADVGEHDVRAAVAVDVADGEVGEPGLVAPGLEAGDGLEPQALQPRLEDSEAIAAGDEQVIAAVAVEIGDVHALEVDGTDQEGAAGPIHAILLGEEEQGLARPVEQHDFLGAVAVGIQRRGPEDLGGIFRYCPSAIELVLDVPVAFRDRVRCGERRCSVRRARAGPSRFVRLTPAGFAPVNGPRPPDKAAGPLLSCPGAIAAANTR